MVHRAARYAVIGLAALYGLLRLAALYVTILVAVVALSAPSRSFLLILYVAAFFLFGRFEFVGVEYKWLLR